MVSTIHDNDDDGGCGSRDIRQVVESTLNKLFNEQKAFQIPDVYKAVECDELAHSVADVCTKELVKNLNHYKLAVNCSIVHGEYGFHESSAAHYGAEDGFFMYEFKHRAELYVFVRVFWFHEGF